jgi:ferric-dicitrate binding protein FerR (iron transport regulator)
MILRGYDDDVETRDAAWLAFRYAAGELDPAESVRFEQCLETDPDACESLVQAVRLMEVARQAARQARPRPRRLHLPARLATSAVAAAATVALYVAMGGLQGPRATDPEIASPWSGEAVQAWASLRPDPEALAWEGESELEDSTASATDPLPSWMLEIASLESPAGPGIEEGQP